MLTGIQSQYTIPDQYVYFSNEKAPSALNGLLINEGLKGIIMGKEYSPIDYMLPLMEALKDRCLRSVAKMNIQSSTLGTPTG